VAEATISEVATVTTSGCTSPPLICTEDGRLQVGPALTVGVMLQLRLTVALNDPSVARVRLKLVLCPGLMVCEVGPEPGPIVKSGAA